MDSNRTSAEHSLALRNAEIEERYRAGETQQEIGDDLGISRERVRQVLNKRGVLAGERVARGNARNRQRALIRRDRRIPAHRQAIVELKRQGLTNREIASRFRLIPVFVGQLVQSEFSKEERRLFSMKKGSERTPDAELLEQLREAYSILGPTMRAEDYNRLAKARGWRSPQTIIIRFGKWSRACELAGIPLEVKRCLPDHFKNFINRATCFAAVREVRDALGHIPTVDEYDRYARTEDELPCLSTVRRRCGGWRNVVRVLLAETKDP